jgi:UDP-glucuronate 4-epimerase
MRYLITGGAGFIGSHLADALLARGDEVVCFDNFNDYYSPARKRRNIAAALNHSSYTLVEADLRDAAAVDAAFRTYRPTHVAHLGAMANPRASVQRPFLYEEVNVRGTMHILDAARRFDVQHLVVASTSSVYGLSPTPWSEDLPADRPLSPYAATKRSAELLAYTFHQQYGVPTQVVRFFTVYGPRGRPDMTPHLFVNAMIKRQPITLFNGGVGVYRDWTYIDDIIAGVVATLDSNLPFETINLGNSNPTQLRDFIELVEAVTGLRAQIEERPLSAAEPPTTFANIDKARRLLHFAPRTQLADGLTHFWDWYQAEVLQDA